MIELEKINVIGGTVQFRIKSQAPKAYSYTHENPFIASNGVHIISAANPQVSISHRGFTSAPTFFIRGDFADQDRNGIECSAEDYEKVEQAVEELNQSVISSTVVFND